MDSKEFLLKEQARGTVFNLFTALLCQPDEELVNSVHVFDTLNSAFKIVATECVSDVNWLKESISQYSVTELLVEYTRLFIGPFGLVAPPYSSVYFGDNNVLMSEETLRVINFYTRMGLKFNAEEVKDAPDHVVIETEFMYHLLFNEAKELEAGNIAQAEHFWQSQHEFFTKHYQKWVPKFCKKITDNTKNDYYKELAGCLSKFVTTAEVPVFPSEVNLYK